MLLPNIVLVSNLAPLPLHVGEDVPVTAGFLLAEALLLSTTSNLPSPCLFLEHNAPSKVCLVRLEIPSHVHIGCWESARCRTFSTGKHMVAVEYDCNQAVPAMPATAVYMVRYNCGASPPSWPTKIHGGLVVSGVSSRNALPPMKPPLPQRSISNS